MRQKSRDVIQKLLGSGDSELYKDSDLNAEAFHLLGNVQLHLPLQFPEFTDFSAFEEHVGNVSISQAMHVTKALDDCSRHL